MSKIIFITHADLGSKKNLKSNEATKVIEYLKPEVVFCRDFDDFEIEGVNLNKFLPFGDFIPKAFNYLNIKTEITLFSTLNYSLIDFSLKRKFDKIVQSGDVVLVHNPYFVPSILNNPNKNYTTVIFHGSMLLKTNEEIYLNLCKEEKIEPTVKFDKSYDDVLKYGDKIICYSTNSKENLIKNGFEKENIEIINLGSDAKNIKLKKNWDKKISKKLRLLCVADFTLMKGLQYMLKAYRNLLNEGYDVSLTLVGSLTLDVKKIIERDFKDIQNKINFVGHANPIKYYQNSDVFIFPSFTEGLPRVMLEAASYGLVLVSTEVFPLIENNISGIVVKKGSSKEIEDAIKYLFGDRKRIVKLKRASRKLAEKTDWDLFGKKLVKYVKNIKNG